MYGVGVIIFWIICLVVGLAGLAAVGRRLPVRTVAVFGIGLFIVFALPSLDDPDPVIRWLVTPPLVALAVLAVVIIGSSGKRPPQS